MLIFVNIEAILGRCALFFCSPREVILAYAPFLLHPHCKLKHRERKNLNKAMQYRGHGTLCSLQYKLFSEPVEYRKISGKRLQNHGTAKVEMNIWRSHYPLSCSEEALPEQAAQGQSRQVKAVVQLHSGHLLRMESP